MNPSPVGQTSFFSATTTIEEDFEEDQNLFASIPALYLAVVNGSACFLHIASTRLHAIHLLTSDSLADRLVTRETNFWISAINWRMMPVSTNLMNPSAITAEHVLKQARTAMGLTLEQVPSSPTARLLGYSQKEEPPDIVPRQHRYFTCKVSSMKIISIDESSEKEI